MAAILPVLASVAAGCQSVVPLPYVGKAPDDRQVCVVGCEKAPSSMKITQFVAEWDGPDTVLVRGRTTGDIAARTTRYELRTTPDDAVIVATIVSDGTSKKRDIGATLTVPKSLRRTQTGRDLVVTVFESATVGGRTQSVRKSAHATRTLIAFDRWGQPLAAPVDGSATRSIDIRATTSAIWARLGTIRGLSITGPDASSFAVVGDTCVGAASCTAQITFLPGSEGPKTASLVVDSASPDVNRLELTGLATPAPPAPAVPTVRPGGAILQRFENAVFTVTNTTAAPITVEPPKIVDSSRNAFFHPIIGADPSRDCFYGATLPPGGSCDATASFAGAPDGQLNPWATFAIPITGGPTLSVNLFGILPASGGTAGTAAARKPRVRRPATVSVVFDGRFRSNVAPLPGTTPTGRRALVVSRGALRATARASSGVRVPIGLRRLLHSRFEGRGSIVAGRRTTTATTLVVTRPSRAGRICARMRVRGDRSTGRGTITVLGGTGTVGRLRGRLSFQIFEGDVAAGVARVRTAAARPLPRPCRTLLAR